MGLQTSPSRLLYTCACELLYLFCFVVYVYYVYVCVFDNGDVFNAYVAFIFDECVIAFSITMCSEIFISDKSASVNA